MDFKKSLLALHLMPLQRARFTAGAWVYERVCARDKKSTILFLRDETKGHWHSAEERELLWLRARRLHTPTHTNHRMVMLHPWGEVCAYQEIHTRTRSHPPLGLNRILTPKHTMASRVKHDRERIFKARILKMHCAALNPCPTIIYPAASPQEKPLGLTQKPDKKLQIKEGDKRKKRGKAGVWI